MPALIRRGDRTLTRTGDDTRFQIASVSKQFTAAAVLLLAGRGALSLDDPIDRSIGDCPPAWRDITLHHLLTHTSGLGHWSDHPAIDLAERVAPAALRQAFHRVPPLFRPGARFHYSSPAYVLLADVVQEAAGRPYHDFLDAELFTPLGLTATFAGSPGDRPGIAQGHDKDGHPVGSWELDVVHAGAGDIWSTTADLDTWMLSEPYRALGAGARVPTGLGEDESGYGYGLYTGSVRGHRWCHHSGDNAGFIAFAACLPELDCRIVLLSNSDAHDPAIIAELLDVALA